MQIQTLNIINGVSVNIFESYLTVKHPTLHTVDNIFLIIDRRRASAISNKIKITVYHTSFFESIHDLRKSNG